MNDDKSEDQVEKLFSMAIAFRDAGEYSKAIAPLKKILLIPSAKKAPIFGMMGYIYNKLNNLENARDCYQKAVALSPTSELGSLGLFHVLWDMGRTWEAIAEAKRFLAIRDSKPYFELIEEMRDAYADVPLELTGH